MEFVDDLESLLGSFMDISNALIKAGFIFQSESKIFEVIDLFYCHACDGSV